MPKHFKPAFRQEVAELVVDKQYSIREAAEAMGVGKSTVDKWARQLRKEPNGEQPPGTPISEENSGPQSLDVFNEQVLRVRALMVPVLCQILRNSQ